VNVDAQRPLLVFCPDIVVATPSRALEHLKAKNLKLKESLEILVIDEADLIFSFGFENEIREIVRYLPSVYQAALASATLSEDVLNLKRLVLHNPVTLKLNEAQLAPPEQLAHYALTAEEQDKAALLCTMLKLQLVRGKTIIFVNTVDKCY
ncbi:Eukaryotic initiation factor 4A, partial [Gryllus bimaculatus]